MVFSKLNTAEQKKTVVDPNKGLITMQASDNVWVRELLHEVGLLQEFLYHLQVSTGECLYSHWNLTRVASYVLRGRS